MNYKLEKSVFVRVCRRHLPNPRSKYATYANVDKRNADLADASKH